MLTTIVWPHAHAILPAHTTYRKSAFLSVTYIHIIYIHTYRCKMRCTAGLVATR